MDARITIPFIALALAACASTPDVVVNYYFPQTAVSLHIVRTVACDTDKHVITSGTVTATITHSADLTKRQTIALKSLDGALSDTDFQLQLYEDGRLKGINATTTGQAEATIKPLVTAAAKAFGAGVTAQNTPSPDACSFSTDATKPVTVNFTGNLDFTGLGGVTGTGGQTLVTDQRIDPDADSVLVFGKTTKALGYTCVHSEKLRPQVLNTSVSPSYVPADAPPASGNAVELLLQQPALVGLTVWSSDNKGCSNFGSDSKPIWTGQTEVAQAGTTYHLPMPKAVLFGKQQFVIAVAESGALTSLQYTKQTGAVSLAAAGNDIATNAAPESAAQKAADLKAEADIIAQQERLVRCKANPTACT